MLSIKVRDELGKILDLLDRKQYRYLSLLFNISDTDDEFFNRIDAYDWLNSPDSDDVARFTSTQENFAKIPVRGLFSDLEAMHDLVTKAESENELWPSPISSKAKGYINDLTKAIEYYLGRKDDRFLFFLLLNKSSRLSIMLRDVEVLSVFIGQKLEQDGVFNVEDNNKRLSIYLDSHVTFGIFILKLEAVNEIYTELAQIMNISVTENPITIRKVESGSVWQDILGYPQIIELVENLINGTVDYFYRTFTNEGKVVSLPRNVDVLETVLHLRKDLQAAGINTDEMDESIRKSSVIIALRLNNLLLGEPRVRVNEKEHFIGDEIEDKYLAESKTFLLGEGTDNRAD